MSLDLDQVLYARAGWRKAVLIPLWVFQVAVLLCLMGIFAYRLAETFEHYEELDKLGEVPIVEVVWEGTNVLFNLVALILTILEVARKATERLTPFFMVCSQVVKLTLALAVLALDIVAYLRRMDGHYSTIGLSLDCGLLAATLATFAYALVTYRRLLKYEDYHLTANAKAQGGYVPGGGESVELGYNNRASYYAHNYPRSEETQQGIIYSDTSYRSQTQTRPYSESYKYPQVQVQPYPEFTTGTSAPESHHHQHPALAPSSSTAELKKQVDQAISYEFGWSSSPGSSPNGTATGNNGTTTTAAADHVNRSGSVVLGSGTVPVRHGMVARPALGVARQQSWVTERGVIAEPDEEEEGGPVLGRGAFGHGHGQGGGRIEEDTEMLLSPTSK
ncbi:hypothetical protein N657DRAFT_680562 [Parathielavia appendiculata]|uniref:Uncharacterized protein n=1 Tax=Parathielavia appendiculata TaxID=2587402 RepID=A0AAN6Z4K2_9PEZI|nr:hypothetical protein N657DRAFT_680562 [Parathielavia appendiculata]